MNTDPAELRTLGNTTLLELPKTAFFCSRDYPAAIEQPTYVWALEQRYRGNCIISGFHSRLEQAVFRYLLQGEKQPIIYVLGRGIQPNIRLEYGPEIEAGRLLFISLFEQEVRTVTQETAYIRNLLLADMADSFFVPYRTPGGNIDRLLDTGPARSKPVFTLNMPENQYFMEQRARPFQPGGLFGRLATPS